MKDEIVEVLARAMRMRETDSHVGHLWEPGEREAYESAWNDAPDDSEDAEYNPDRAAIREKWRTYARACLQALLDHGPTEEMVEAGRSTVGGHLRNEAVAPIFRAMISKALGK